MNNNLLFIAAYVSSAVILLKSTYRN